MRLCMHTILGEVMFVYAYLYKSNHIDYMLNIYSYFFFLCKILHLIKICLCCFLDMHLYSNSSSTIASIPSSILLENYPACFSPKINFNRLHNSLGSEGKNIVCESPEAEIYEPGDLGNFYKCSISSRFIILSFYIKIHFLCKIIIYFFYPMNLMIFFHFVFCIYCIYL